ncbi:hypothetical protein C8Q75DRAFT_807743 [Abortiporus biennis]|nr:hypothetical protein C8Q75DRAFT_807743 [Abortiporus biennis]
MDPRPSSSKRPRRKEKDGKSPTRSKRPKTKSKKAHAQATQNRAVTFESGCWEPVDLYAWEPAPKPTPANFKAWEQQTRVDRLHLFVPYWREGIVAADEGRDPPTMEQFFIQYPDPDEEYRSWPVVSGWQNADDNEGWGNANDNDDGWGVAEADNIWAKEAVNDDAENGWGDVPEYSGWGIAKNDGWPQEDMKQPAVLQNEPVRSDETSRSDPWKDELRTQTLYHEDPYSFVEDIARREAASPERKEFMHRFYAVGHFIESSFNNISSE